jgi:hypothetical protein
MAKKNISFTLNGGKVEALVEPRELLIHVLREQLGLTGSHIGCETSHCGACTVDFNGKSVKSCTLLAVQAEGGTGNHRRRSGEERYATPAARWIYAGARAAMRLLHPGDADAQLSFPTGKSQPDRGADSLGPFGKYMPLYRLPEHREGGTTRR